MQEVSIIRNTRRCKYDGQSNTTMTRLSAEADFHLWFQEGGELNDGGAIDLGALIELSDGSIVKVWDVTGIKFLDKSSESVENESLKNVHRTCAGCLNTTISLEDTPCVRCYDGNTDTFNRWVPKKE